MQIHDVKVGTELTMAHKGGGGTYRVTSIESDEISLENVNIESGIDVYIEDLPGMFIEVVA